MKTFKKVIIPVTASALLLGACGNSATDSKEDTIISSKAGDVKGEYVMNKMGDEQIANSSFSILLNKLLADKYKDKVDTKDIDKEVEKEQKQYGGKDQFESMLKQQKMSLSDYKEQKKLDYLLERFGVPEYKDKKIKELSKGNQQKIQFITAVLNDPELLILDEPFSGLDPINVELFKEYIVELSKKGSMIIFSSHRMEHVELFCKKIAVLKDGKDVLSGDLKDIKKKYRKKNILVKADIDVDKIKSIDGVLDVIEKPDEYEIKISDETVEEKVFKEVHDFWHQEITGEDVKAVLFHEITWQSTKDFWLQKIQSFGHPKCGTNMGIIYCFFISGSFYIF